MLFTTSVPNRQPPSSGNNSLKINKIPLNFSQIIQGDYFVLINFIGISDKFIVVVKLNIENKFFFLFLFDCIAFIIYFCSDFGVTPCFKRVVKRESSENLEQTRCCKLY